MRCVQCGHLEDKVIDSRMSKDGTTIRRRRVCLRCDYRYTTYEQIERTELRVVKRDNLREALNREKILRGLVKACEKRPVSMDRLDRAVEEIISELHRDHLREVPSSEIGKKVIEKLCHRSRGLYPLCVRVPPVFQCGGVYPGDYADAPPDAY